MSETKMHYASTEASNQTYQLYYDGELILESDQAVELKEHYQGQDFAPVIYFPESVISTLDTTNSDRVTHCPIKGDAAYLSYREATNGIWFYPRPLAPVSQIKNHYAFDQSKGFRVSPASR